MRIGIPKTFFYYSYQPFLENFFRDLGMEVVLGGPTDQEILDRGRSVCVDEGCLPLKVLCGQVEKLSEACDKIVLPRIMKTEYGESICPKVAGAADLISTSREKMIFTKPLYLDCKKKLEKVLWKECRKLGIRKGTFKRSFFNGIEAQKKWQSGLNEQAYTFKVFLAGHCGNLQDSFVNMNLLKKLHAMDIGAVTEKQVKRTEKKKTLVYAELIKKPYWSFFINHFTAMQELKKTGIDGVIFVSSFSCGTDSFTIEMLKNNLQGLPMLVLKIDEQRGEAGFDTRLEAFCDVLKERSKKR